MNRVGRTRGFTIVELVVVIVVIAVLSAITAIGFSRYQVDTRDTQREAKATVISEALEKYYDEHGEYPSCPAITAAGTSVTASNGPLANVDQNTLLTPKSTASNGNSIMCTDLVNATSGDVFAYVGDGSATCSSGDSCLSFKLKFINEQNDSVTTINSRHTTDIATSGAISDLASSSVTCTSVGLTWSSTANATGYTVQRALDSGFSSGLDSQTSASNSFTYGALANGTQYYFQVQPSSGAQEGEWSNTVSATTWQLTTPVVTIGTVGANSLSYSWPAVSHATSYSYLVSTDSNFTNIVDSGTTTSTSNTTSGLTAGVQYWVGITAKATGCNDSARGTDSDTTVVPAPTGLSLTVNSNTQITASWNAVPNATAYVVQYSVSSSFSSYTSAPSTTSTSQAVSGLQQGTTWYFRVIAYVGAAFSSPSSTASATTGISGPSGLGITAYRPNAVRAYAAGYWVAWIDTPAGGNWYYAYENAGASCPSGAYPVYQIYAQYNSPTTGYYTGATTAGTWYMAQPTSGYKIKFGARAYCQGPNTNSGWSGWVYSCAANPGSTVGCTF